MLKSVAAACAAGAASFALASAEDVTLKFDAFFLESAEGTEKVYSMIRRRAKSMCQDSGVAGRKRSIREACQAEMIDDFVGSIDHPRLTSYHEGVEAIQLAEAQ